MLMSIYTLVVVAVTVLQSPASVVATAAATKQQDATSMKRSGQGYGLVVRRRATSDDASRHFEDVLPGSPNSSPSGRERTTSPPAFISNDTPRPSLSPTTSPSEADVEEKTVPVTVPVKKGDGPTLTLAVGAVIAIGLAGVMTPFLCGLVIFLCRRKRDEKPASSLDVPSGAALSGSGGSPSRKKKVPAVSAKDGFPSDAAFRCINCTSTEITENSSDADSPPPIATIYIGNSFRKSKRSLRSSRPSEDAIEEQVDDDNRSVHSVNSYFRSLSNRRDFKETGSLKDDYDDEDIESVPLPKDSAHQFDGIYDKAAGGDLNQSFSSYGMDSTYRNTFADHILGGHLTDDDNDFEDVLAAPKSKSQTAQEEEEESFRIMRLAL